MVQEEQAKALRTTRKLSSSVAVVSNMNLDSIIDDGQAFVRKPID